MTIDVAGIIKELGGKVSFDDYVNLDDTDFLGEEFSFTEGLNVKGNISNNGKSLILKGRAKGKANVHCSRCMKPMLIDVDFELDETFMQDKGDNHEIENEDVILFQGHVIELDEVVFNSFLMNASGKYLCSEDCKGLCVKCGADLNLGDCGCNREEIDPRWAKLIEIMDNNK